MRIVRNHGFTLVELIIAVVVVGILAAVGLPRMINFGKDARIAAVEGLAASMWSAATLASAQCHVAPTCNPGVVHSANPPPQAIFGGRLINYHYGYPIAWEGYAAAGTSGLGGFVQSIDISGFTPQPYRSGSLLRVFTKDGIPYQEVSNRPTTNNCAVVYAFKATGGRVFLSITTLTNGC